MMIKLKAIARQFLGDTTMGMIDYYRFSDRREAWGGPFNGQVYRQQIFEWILVNMRPAAILETGTFLGTTTEFLARTGVPVYTIEGAARNYGFARARFLLNRKVTLRLGDSRPELGALFEGPLRSIKHKIVFVYLDAHWNADLPLSEELDIVFQNCPAAVVMIDDFQVPDDPGYGYDEYGEGKALTAEYIARAVERYRLQTFYPSAPSSKEGGIRRGCAILTVDAIHGATLSACPLLRTTVNATTDPYEPRLSNTSRHSPISS